MWEKKLAVFAIMAASIIQLNKYDCLGNRDGSKLCCTVFSKQIWQLFRALQVYYKTITVIMDPTHRFPLY